MTNNQRFLLSSLALLLALAPFAVQAQDVATYDPNAPQTQQAAPTYSPEQLAQLLAPVALYPDPLIGQVLMASTYPLEIVEATRWLQASGNAGMSGPQLAAALDQQPWDPSVKALVAVPQVLTMMDKNLQWTEQLGDAFLAQQNDVMNTVQGLRQRAETAGALRSTQQETVDNQGSYIAIEPANPDVVYVPAYNPNVVYGSWMYPGYQPYSFYPANYAWGSTVIGFGVGVVVAESIWGWDRWDWRDHRIDIDDRRFAALNHGRPPAAQGQWHFDPDHRHGVPFNSAANRAHFQPANANERAFRGFNDTAPAARPVVSGPVRANAPTPQFNRAAAQPRVNAEAQQQHFAQTQQIQQQRAAPQVQQQRVEQQRPATPVFESFDRGSNVRVQAQRGAESRASQPTFSAPRPQPQQQHFSPPPQQQHSAPAPAAHPAGGNGGGGGRGNEDRR